MSSPLSHDPALLQAVASLPRLPGVYRYFDAQGAVLYVGKARDLQRRVGSYFSRPHTGTRIGHMVAQIAHLETTVVRSETEALLLEYNLIKALQPRYNIVFRDDKSYPCVRFSATTPPSEVGEPRPETYARVSYHRGRTDGKHRYFGPYPNVSAVKTSLELLQKVFRLRTCDDAVFRHRSRPCLLAQIKRCSAPCVGWTDPVTYAADVAAAAAFLQGDSETVLQGLHDKMWRQSEALAFEQAAETRNQILALSQVWQDQVMDNVSDQDVDIVAVHLQGGRACVNLAMVRGGRHLGDRACFPVHVEAAIDAAGWDDEEAQMRPPLSAVQTVMEAFLLQHYLELPPPPVLVLSCPIDPEVAQALSGPQGQAVQWVTQPRGHRRTWLEMAVHNAQGQLARLLAEEGSQQARTRALAQALGAADGDLSDWRIECFDISHTSGEATTASCVVFEQHQMQPAQYRRYAIEGITPGDDLAAMRQALNRRYAAWTGEHEPHSTARWPDVVLIDGGVGQVAAARAVFEAKGLDLGRLVGVEKGQGRRVGLEELVFADGREKVYLGAESAALMLVAQIRDEAHRFAITGMRVQRAKTRFSGGRLQDIPGVGPKKRAALLQRFGSVKAVSDAAVADLARVPGISLALAETIYRALRG